MFEPLVAIVDDDPQVRESTAALLRSAAHRVECFPSTAAFQERASNEPPACLILDVQLPGTTGLELQRDLLRSSIEVPIVFITGHGDIAMSVTAMKAGALDFFTKPFDPDQLLEAVKRGVTRSTRGVLETNWKPTSIARSELIGQSHALDRLLGQVRLVAKTHSTVLIYGETGSGKELVARAIHDQSGRRGPLIKVNCAAVPSGLFESELMGHEKGSFTGASSRRIGRFELAQDGTIFLDEIGEMSLEAQPKLLRLLQEREFERVGGSKTLRSNARLVAATNRNLWAMVARGQFREDLFYRLNVFPIEITPLREQRGVIAELAQHFASLSAERLGRPLAPLSDTVLDRLRGYDWPGNVRELQSVIERAAILAIDGVVTLDTLGPLAPMTEPRCSVRDALRALPSMQRPAWPVDERLESVDRRHIVAVLEASDWVVSGSHGAAARLGMKRSTLLFRMKKLGIRRGTREVAQVRAQTHPGGPPF